MLSRTAKRRPRSKASEKPAPSVYLKYYPQVVEKLHQSTGMPGLCQSPLPSDVLSGLLLEDAILFNSTKKIENSPDKVLFLSIVAGIWVGMGGVTAVCAAGGIPEDVRNQWVSLPKFLMGGFFAFALHFIAMFGGELFTGNTMILAVGFYNKIVPLNALLLNWLIVYNGDWIGTLLVCYFLGYLTRIFDTAQYKDFLAQLVVQKLEDLNWGEIFLRAIGANAMVCMALVLGLACRNSAGKIMALWFPVVFFVLSGYEHCVANMIFCSLGLMYGAPSTVGRLWYNQSAALCGNIIGGAIFIGLIEHLMNHWQSPIFHNSRPGVGTLAAHDVESSRRARDVIDIHPADLVAHARSLSYERNRSSEPNTARTEQERGLSGQASETSSSSNNSTAEFHLGSTGLDEAHERRKVWRALLGMGPITTRFDYRRKRRAINEHDLENRIQ